jgi:hypothetical protein
MSAVMIPCSVAATLTADLSYNPSVHVQTVEIDRVGTNLLEMATNNFVKWYLRVGDFLNLVWNMRDVSGVNNGVFTQDVSDSSPSENIFTFARSGDHASSTETVPVWNDTGASFGDEGLLVTEASGAGVRFSLTNLSIHIPLTNDSSAYGASDTVGTGAYVGATNVTYDRVLLDSDATTSISASTAHNATATTTSWSFDSASFQMNLNWSAGQTGENAYNSYHASWGRSEIYVYADTISNIEVTKPYNDAAADFIQIGMDASGGSSTFDDNTTVFGHGAHDKDDVLTSEQGLVDPITSNSMSSGSADDINDSIAYGSYFSDHTANHNNSYGSAARRNLINVSISKPTITVSQASFTKGLQQAINADISTQDVSNTASLRAAVRQAWVNGDLSGFQSGQPHNTSYTYNADSVELELPVTVAGQERKLDTNTGGVTETAATISDNTTYSAGAHHKKVWLTPIIELVADNFYHDVNYYTYHSGIV